MQKKITIDCGFGVIQYLEPDNLRLRQLMEDFKEKLEKEHLLPSGNVKIKKPAFAA